MRSTTFKKGFFVANNELEASVLSSLPICKKKKHKTSRRERIIQMFTSDAVRHTCQNITKCIIIEEELTGSKAKYLSGSISSILAKLVKDEVLMYADEQTDRGGHIYQLYKKKE